MKIDKGVQKPLLFNIIDASPVQHISLSLSFFLSNQRKVELTRFNNSIDNQEEQQEAEAEGEEKRMAMMIGGRSNYGLIVFLILLGHFFCSGLKVRIKDQSHEEKQLHFTTSISTTQKDITTPITTVPTITITPTTPTSSTPIMNPTSTPDSTSPVTTTSSSTTTTSSTSASWCVSSQSASQMALQVALDYACGYGGTDCSEIQLGRSCYNPNTVRDHASYAFNTYYQKNPVPNSCNFGGTAVITSTDPSTGTCQFPSTSTSSSVLNTTNSSGSTVFGAVPSRPSTSAAAATENLHCLRNVFTMMCLMVVLIT